MHVVKNWVDFGRPTERHEWHVEHEGKVLNIFRTRDEARKAIKDSGELAAKLTPRLDFVNCRGE